MENAVMMTEEMMRAAQLALPAVVLALLTLLVSALMTAGRLIGVTSGKLPGEYYALYRGDNPAGDFQIRVERHYHNLLGAPILFYATIPLILALGAMDSLFVALAWWYVGFRLVHTLVHVFINHPLMRLLPWFGSYVVLVAIWIKLLLLTL